MTYPPRSPTPSVEMASPSIRSALPGLPSKLTLDEKISLLGGIDFNRFGGCDRLGLPYLKVADGPNGVRGMETGLNHILGFPFHDNGKPAVRAAVLPCSTAVAATFDVDAARRAGREIALDGLSKNVRMILAPTVNIVRDPRNGRTFEAFSEDPLLTAAMGAAWTQGAQDDAGVQVTLKHLVGNECETNRHGSNVVASAATLREVYLKAFERIFSSLRSQGLREPASIMMAYNDVDGESCSSNRFLIEQVLRKEWRYDGLVMSDWFGTYKNKESFHAGLDLEMPGRPEQRTLKKVKALLDAGEITEAEHIDPAVRRVVESFARAEEWLSKDAAGEEHPLFRPEQYAAGADKECETPNERIDAEARRMAAEACVLFKNEGSLLPIEPRRQGIKKIALIGHPAREPMVTGGGSARINAYSSVTAEEGIRATLDAQGCKDVELVWCEGTGLDPNLPLPEVGTHLGGKPVELQWHQIDAASDAIVEPSYFTSSIPQPMYCGLLGGFQPKERYHAIRVRFELTPQTSGSHTVSLQAYGSIKLEITPRSGGASEKMVWEYEGEDKTPVIMFNPRRLLARRQFSMAAGETFDMLLEYRAPKDGKMPLPTKDSAFRFGFQEEYDEQASIRAAAKVASEADLALVFTATGPDYESEGIDRETIALPLLQDELVSAIAAAAPGKTAVINASGAAVTMPWVDSVASILQVWFAGHESGRAIADALFGTNESGGPSGRSPFTWPKRIEDHSSFGNFPTTEGVEPVGFGVRYAEGRCVGHRHYEKKSIEPLWWFGQGDSYTTFDAVVDARDAARSITKDRDAVSFSVQVTNTGARKGRYVTQVYVKRPQTAPGVDEDDDQPIRKLAFFASSPVLAPGESTTVEVKVDSEAFVTWKQGGWEVEKGQYHLVLASSADPKAEIGQPIPVDVESGWRYKADERL